MSGDGPQLSPKALEIIAMWFATHPESVLRSAPPHETLEPYREAMDELIAAGIITRHLYNRLGTIEYKGSAKAVELGRPELQRQIRELFA